MMADFAQFDPEDTSDIVADMFRMRTVELMLEADKVTVYRELSPQRQIECFAAGVLTGLIGALFACSKSEGHDALFNYVRECLPFARIQAEGMKEDEANASLASEGREEA
jgi:hypothetical protein